jgi:hypothetical protein
VEGRRLPLRIPYGLLFDETCRFETFSAFRTELLRVGKFDATGGAAHERFKLGGTLTGRYPITEGQQA